MAIHFTTFVLPSMAPLNYAVPFLALGADSPGGIGQIPLVTSAHRRGNVIMPFCHASMVLGETPVSDAWIRAVGEDYDGRVKAVVVRESVAGDISTDYAPLPEGVAGPDLPPWVAPLLAGKMHAVSRDIPVSHGEGLLSIRIDPSAPVTLPGWAHRVITPG